MRKIRDVLRLHAAGLSKRRIAASLTIGATAAGAYLRRARRAGLTWPLPEGLSDEDLERLVFPPPPIVAEDHRSLPDWPALHRELRKRGVTLSLLWRNTGLSIRTAMDTAVLRPLPRLEGQAVADHAPGPCRRRQDVRRLCRHHGGVVDGLTGEVRAAQVFVATLGRRAYTYAEATWTQGLADWIGSHTRAFAFFGGVPAQVVPDNLRSGVAKACLYDPEINRTYADMAAHHDTAVVPPGRASPAIKPRWRSASGGRAVGSGAVAQSPLFGLAELRPGHRRAAGRPERAHHAAPGRVPPAAV
ncbi:MAG: transposase [Rhodospirillales bacterium]|nr:transposase [Rhodospirillales bacterium]